MVQVTPPGILPYRSSVRSGVSGVRYDKFPYNLNSGGN